MSSFQTYLNNYCNELSGQDTRSLKLFASKLEECPRLKEPLLLLALTQNREEYLFSHISDKFKYSYETFMFHYRESKLPLEGYLKTLDDTDRYKKCFNSWCSSTTALEKDRKFLVTLSEKLSALLKEKEMTRAFVCNEKNLNKGNFYAFLKGDVTKMSRKTAVSVYRYVEDYK